jgi:hypothetical protein
VSKGVVPIDQVTPVTESPLFTHAPKTISPMVTPEESVKESVVEYPPLT